MGPGREPGVDPSIPGGERLPLGCPQTASARPLHWQEAPPWFLNSQRSHVIRPRSHRADRCS